MLRPAGAELPWQVVASGLQFPESPRWSERDGCLYLVDWTADQVLAFRDGSLRPLFDTGGGGPSGLGQDSQGTLWLALYSAGKLAAYTAQGKLLGAWDSFAGTPLRGPCDLACDPAGGVYFTDSGDFEQDWRSGRAAGWVYHLSAAGPGGFADRRLRRLAGPLHFPNGIALSPDQSFLYVNEHRMNCTLRYRVGPDGGLEAETTFYRHDPHSQLEPAQAFELGPDGLCTAPDGSLFVAHYGGGKILQLSPQGRLVRRLPLPQGRRPTSAGWRPGENALYVTEAEFGLLYRLAPIG
jgi:sugar lactone lactonase YvrE